MKVFRVITRISDSTSNEVREVSRYVTQANDLLFDVVKYYHTVHCEGFDEELVSVSEVLIISEQLP